MDWPTLPHSSGVEQQQPTPHNYAEKTDSSDDFAIASARPISSGSSDEMSDNERTGTRKENSQMKESSQKKEKEKSRQMPRPYPATTSKSSNGPSAGSYPEVAAQSTITLRWPQSKRSQMSATASSRVACLSPVPALRGMLDVHGEQLAHRRRSTGAAGCMADSSNLNLNAMEDFEMYK